MSSAYVRTVFRHVGHASRVFIVCCISVAAIGCSDDESSVNPGTSAGSGATSGGGTAAGRGGAGAGAGATAGGTAPAAGANASGTGGRSGTSGAGAGAIAGTTSVAGAGAGGNSSGPGDDTDAGVPQDASMPMSMDDDDAGACVMPSQPLSLAGVPKCSPDICPAQDSVCLPMNVLAQVEISPESLALLADCDVDSKCVPERLAMWAGRVNLTKCESILGAEGRCLSTCVPQVALQSEQLPRANCEESELCAPCYDPRTGEATGACSQGCDLGPTEPPRRFPSCCDDRGLCVPPALAADQAPNLDRDTCSGDNLCAPAEFTDPTFKPATCESLDGAEGRCVSTCVGGAVARQRDRLPRASCDADELCAPCYDPITGEDTGACRVNGDAPAEPAYTFARCCGDGDDAVGVCVPPELAGEQSDILRPEECSSDRLCAPVEKALDPNYRFPTCMGLLGDGACVPTCIVDPVQALILSQATCDDGELCAPCNLLGSPTGACE